MLRWLRRILIVFVVLVVVIGGGTGWVVWRATQAPEWYAPLDPASPRVAAVGERLEYGIVEEFQRIRPDAEPWTLRLHEEQLNAWLAARLPEWLDHDDGFTWPDELGTPQLRLGDDGLELAVEVQIDADRPQIVTAKLIPEVRDGVLHLSIDRVGVGRFSLPAIATDGVLAVMEQMSPDGSIGADAAEKIVAMLTGATSGDDDDDDDDADTAGGIRLGDGRRIEMLDVLIADGTMDLTSRTMPPTAEGESPVASGEDATVASDDDPPEPSEDETTGEAGGG